MADTRKIIKVFLASPGDLSDERRAAKAVVDEFNKLWADKLGYHVELVGWEDTVSRYGRPQELINQDLDLCELFIGMIWKRWGTPPSVDGEYRAKAFECLSLAECINDPERRTEILRYAQWWMQLAEPVGTFRSAYEVNERESPR